MAALLIRTTIWIAMALFLTGEVGRRLARERGVPVAWAWMAFALGAGLCAAHFVAVFHWHHDWSHADAVAATARQTEAVFGVAWGGGVWFNYVFLLAWMGDAMAWARDPRSATRPPSAGVWALRAFYALVIVNATVVFVPWPTTLAGVAICAGLAWSWRPHARAGSTP